MTARELIDGLRERGYNIIRSREPGWVLIPRVRHDDPIVDWLRAQGAVSRNFEPERFTRPNWYGECEINLARVDVDLPHHDDEDDGEYQQRQRRAVWDAASRTLLEVLR